MRLLSLKIQNFRNISEAYLEFPPGEQLLIGKNAQGKTSLLEAVYYLATATSHRTRQTRELIRKGSRAAFLSAEFERDESRHTLSAGWDEGERRFRLDDRPVLRISDIYGHLRVVFFAPEDLEFISGPPSERRRTLDLGLCQKNPSMVQVLLDYRRTLKQRNLLLKKTDSPIHQTKQSLEAWDSPLSRLGAKIVRERAIHALRLVASAGTHYAAITGSRERLDGGYRFQAAHQTWTREDETLSEEEIRDLLNRSLEQTLERDLAHRATSVGPHRDDLKLKVDETTARRYASQGQRRSIALALKLAEKDLIEKETGSPPILLVDDVMHEIDSDRFRRFLERIQGSGQVFMTFTEEESHRGLIQSAPSWRVDDGSFIPDFESTQVHK